MYGRPRMGASPRIRTPRPLRHLSNIGKVHNPGPRIQRNHTLTGRMKKYVPGRGL